MRRKILAGNWKLNGNAALCEQFADGLAVLKGIDCDIVICPPVTYLAALASSFERRCQAVNVQTGAQNVAAQSSGAFTGEVSADMLAECGARYVIVGHSERRQYFAETDEIVLEKVQRALAAQLTPILCVGESLAVREAGDAEAFVAAQLRAVYSNLDAAEAQQIVVAYEPVWAIGTGMSATPEQAQQMHVAIRRVLVEYVNADAVTLLYGGSVNESNAAELLALADVDGALIGGASLAIETFSAIVQAA